MEYLQYSIPYSFGFNSLSFKPYYKWNTFNTKEIETLRSQIESFKPYYKWNTFNTYKEKHIQT